MRNKYLNEEKYHSLCNMVNVKGDYENYKICADQQMAYVRRAADFLKNKKPKKVVIIFLESGPKSMNNFMFNDLKFVKNTDSYLNNIYNGFLNKSPKVNCKKKELLTNLLNTRIDDNHVPVIILDLFSFHGINLGSRKKTTPRKLICENIEDRLMLQDVKNHLSALRGSREFEAFFLFGVPFTIWNYAGGVGPGSIYMNNFSKQNGPLGVFRNKTVIKNVGGQNISSSAIKIWVEKEFNAK